MWIDFIYFKRNKRGWRLAMIIAGVDSGSIATKTVIIEGRKILASNTMDTGLDPRRVAANSLENALKKAKKKYEDLGYIVATGHGRRAIEFANTAKPEIMACAKGARMLHKETRLVVEIGGQGIRVVALNRDGTVDNFSTNDKCSAGTGCFLDAMAFALGVELEDLGDLSGSSSKPENVSTKCTIFAESEVVSLVARGKNKEDIIAGLHDSVAKKVSSMIKPMLQKTVGDVAGQDQSANGSKVFFAGGVAQNIGVKNALEKVLGLKLYSSKNPQIVTALGAALMAPKKV
jgi:predicted CoA-substrate-specific enzyme activase